eukprot:Hpha_TRINITY_DN3890_c0_g1::TRINITY_DN3890_c0_g1_i1::g.44506::m.44506
MADAKRRRVAPKTFSFSVKGQKGEIPQLGLGTATLGGGVTPDDNCVSAVKAAIRAGYRHLDTALLYNNQEAIGQALKELFAAGEVKREDIFITSKVGFYPPKATGDNLWCPINWCETNRHGYENVKAAVDLCLKKLQLDYVDLFLIHNPATELDEYMASGLPHQFEIGLRPGEVKFLPEERELLMQHRLKKANAVYDEGKAEAIRADSWRGLEEVLQQKKCRFIGVSNYPPRLMQAMEKYAKVFPCVNQLELHPRFSSPTLQRYCKEKGVVLTAYGTGNSARIETGTKHGVVAAELAKKYGVCPTRIHLRWTLQRGIVVIPRTAHEGKIAANFAAASGEAFELTAEEMGRLDALNEAYPYYWSPLPCQPPGTKGDV